MTGPVTGIDYNAQQEEYLAQLRAKYLGTGSSSGASDASIFNNTNSAANNYGGNTCTDGNDDGKIGFWSAAGNATEGVFKGAVNGFKSMLGFNEDGSWNPLKLLGSVALVGASIVCPAVGVVACTVGAVSGAVQVGKGIYTAATATSDAEAKQAWENIGEGTSTVIGSVAGAKASMGAMKGASLSAVDDIAKSADDVMKSADDVTGSLSSALKNKGYKNADEIAEALKGVDLKDAKAVEAALKQNNIKLSALDNVDDSLTGMKKLEAQGKALFKDGVSSTKHNATKAWSNVKTAKANKAYNKALDSADEAAEAVNEASKPLNKSIRRQYENTNVEGLENELKNLYKNPDKNADKIKYLEALKKQKLANKDVAEIAGSLDDATKTRIKTQRISKKYSDKLDELENAAKKLDELTTDKKGKKLEGEALNKVKKSKEYKEALEAHENAKKAVKEVTIDDVTKAKIDKQRSESKVAQQRVKDKEAKLKDAQGELKGKKGEARTTAQKEVASKKQSLNQAQTDYNAEYGNVVQRTRAKLTQAVDNSAVKQQFNQPITGKDKAGILSKIRHNGLDTEMLKAFSKDGKAIIEFLQTKSLPEAISNYGYNNVMEVLQTAYGLGLADGSI